MLFEFGRSKKAESTAAPETYDKAYSRLRGAHANGKLDRAGLANLASTSANPSEKSAASRLLMDLELNQSAPKGVDYTRKN